jgi:hypothetical protein
VGVAKARSGPCVELPPPNSCWLTDGLKRFGGLAATAALLLIRLRLQQDARFRIKIEVTMIGRGELLIHSDIQDVVPFLDRIDVVLLRISPHLLDMLVRDVQH